MADTSSGSVQNNGAQLPASLQSLGYQGGYSQTPIAPVQMPQIAPMPGFSAPRLPISPEQAAAATRARMQALSPAMPQQMKAAPPKRPQGGGLGGINR